MAKQLVIMRHAHAPSGRDDHARELDGKGRAEARQIARELDEAGCAPGRWLASDAERVRQTLEAAAGELDKTIVEEGEDGPGGGRWVVDWRRDLYLADRESLLEHLWGLPSELGSDRPVGLAGHNPGLSDVVSWLTGVQTKLPTGGTVLLDGPDPQTVDETVDQSWGVAAKQNRWEMVECWRPMPV